MWQFVTRLSIMELLFGWTLSGQEKETFIVKVPDRMSAVPSISLLRPKHLNVQRQIWQAIPRL